MSERTMVEALNLALDQEMGQDDSVLVLGEDVGEDGGIFRVTEGLHSKYGAERVVDTPLAEAAIVGSSLGMCLVGLRPVCEMQFSGFSYFAFHQIESHVARYRWRSQGRYTAPMVIRMPYGAGVRALEHHSESKEAFFAHIPGLKTVIPSGPRNARALLVSAMRDPDPVVFMEPKALYRSVEEEVPDDEETLPIGEARIAREGEDLTVITYGAMVGPSLEMAERLSEEDSRQAEVIDLLTISPLDQEVVAESVRKTGRVVIVNEAHESFGPASEIVSSIVERSFFHLEVPIEKVTGYDVHVPLFAREHDYLPDLPRIHRAARRALS